VPRFRASLQTDDRTMPQPESRRTFARSMVLLPALLLLVACAADATRSLQLVSGSGVVYPPEAKSRGVEGYVVVRYDVDAAGQVINARVIEAKPEGVFDAAALETVSTWRFRAAEGAAVRVVEGVQSRVEFSLDSGDAYRDY
jgi:protein TonB